MPPELFDIFTKLETFVSGGGKKDKKGTLNIQDHDSVQNKPLLRGETKLKTADARMNVAGEGVVLAELECSCFRR